MEEIDMFHDLEETLCEGLTNLNFNRNDDVNETEIDVSCLENITDLSKIHGPAVRSYNLLKATKAYQDKKYLDSVFFETFALSLYMRIRFHANKVMEGEFHMPTEDNLLNLLEEKRPDQPEFIDYLDLFLKDQTDDAMRRKQLKSIEFENGTELMELCHELPKEWTIIQLCKQFNPEVFLETREETLRHACPIFMTLFNYQMSERFDHQPIKIVLNQENLKELYESSQNMSAKYESNDYQYFHDMKEDFYQAEIISKIKKLFGPWIALFSGKRKPEWKHIDDKIIARVDLFLSTSSHKYSKRQSALICLLALRIDMLTDEDIKEGSLLISKTKEEWWDVWDFLEDCQKALFISRKEKDRFKTREEHCDEEVGEFYPVILVVDEHIDFMYWEMCNPSQEVTRVDSMVTLLKLYFHHQHNITNGYYNVKGKRGSAVVNPDCTLPTFTLHIASFLKSLPNFNWKCLIDKEPKFPDLNDMLANSDVYVYCGHGSGLQFISAYETCQLNTNAVVFLMGCSSVAFKADSGYSLASAAHHYYHIAKSPAVIGHLNLTYVNVAAIFFDTIVGKWLYGMDDYNYDLPDVEPHFLKKLKQHFKRIRPTSCLTKLISQYKNDSSIPIGFRAIIVYRGLPVQLAC